MQDKRKSLPRHLIKILRAKTATGRPHPIRLNRGNWFWTEAGSSASDVMPSCPTPPVSDHRSKASSRSSIIPGSTALSVINRTRRRSHQGEADESERFYKTGGERNDGRGAGRGASWDNPARRCAGRKRAPPFRLSGRHLSMHRLRLLREGLQTGKRNPLRRRCLPDLG